MFAVHYPFAVDLIEYGKVWHLIQNFTAKLPNHIDSETGRVSSEFSPGWSSYRTVFPYGGYYGKALSLLPQRLADTGARRIRTVHEEIVSEAAEKMADDAGIISGKLYYRGRLGIRGRKIKN